MAFLVAPESFEMSGQVSKSLFEAKSQGSDVSSEVPLVMLPFGTFSGHQQRATRSTNFFFT